MIKVIDNFLTKSYYKYILELLTSPDFGWNYSSNITGVSQSLQFNDYGFSHIFWHDETGQRNNIHSHFIQPLLYQIMDVANCDFIIRARADMVTWSKEEFMHQPHTDFKFPNTASVFYINETDGDTIFYNVEPKDVPKDKDYKDLKEYDRVSPKANRLAIFDGDLLHTGCSPTKHKNRILINSNYIKKEYLEEFRRGQESNALYS